MNIDNLAEGKWIRDKLGQEFSGIDPSDRTIVRKLEQLPIKDVSALVEILRQRTSVKNPNDGKKYYSVENPMVDGVVLPGIWRCITIKGIVDPAVGPAGVIQQVLAYGWANSISWAEARLADSLEMQPLGATDYRFLTVIFPNIAIDKMYTLAETLGNTSTFASPVVEGHTFAGTWFNSGVETGKSKDGSGIITLKLSIEYRDVEFHVTAQNSHSIVETRQQLGITSQDAETITPDPGEARERIVEVNKDSSKNIKTLKDIGVAQTGTTTIVSPAGVTVVEEKSVQESQLSVPDALRGYIYRVVNKVSKYFSRYDTVMETTQPTDQEALIDSASYAEIVKTEKHTEAGDPDPATITLNEAGTDIAADSAVQLVRGKIITLDGERTQAGNMRTVKKTIVPRNQTAQEASADNFVYSAKKTEKETAYFDDSGFLAKLTSMIGALRDIKDYLVTAWGDDTNGIQDGEAADVTWEETPAGNIKIGMSIDKVQDDKEESVTREVDAFSTKTTTVKTGATARVAENAPAFAAGTIQYLVDKWMKFKNRYQTTAITDVATPRTAKFAAAMDATTGSAIFIDRSDTSITAAGIFHNQTTAPTINEGEVISSGVVLNRSVKIVGLTLNRHGLFDYVKLTTYHAVPMSGTSGSWTTTGDYYWLPVGYKTDGRIDSVQKYQKKWTHTLKFHLTLATASSATNNGVQGSTVYRLGDYLYCSHKIVRSDTAVGGLVSFPD